MPSLYQASTVPADNQKSDEQSDCKNSYGTSSEQPNRPNDTSGHADRLATGCRERMWGNHVFNALLRTRSGMDRPLSVHMHPRDGWSITSRQPYSRVSPVKID